LKKPLIYTKLAALAIRRVYQGSLYGNAASMVLKKVLVAAFS
jgi:hypothetical protein